MGILGVSGLGARQNKLERVRTRVNGRQQALGTCQEGPRNANSTIRGLSYGITVCQLTTHGPGGCGTLEAYLCRYITFLLLRGLTAALVSPGPLPSFHASKHPECRVEDAWTCSAPHPIYILPASAGCETVDTLNTFRLFREPPAS